MATYELISADSHIVEPPDLYTSRIEPKLRDRAPRMERMETPTGRKYDAWFIDGMQVGTLGAVMQAGQRFEDPSQIDFLGVWEDVRIAAYDPQAMIKRPGPGGSRGRTAQETQGCSRGPYLLRVRQPSLPAALLLRRRMNWRRFRAAARNLSRWLSIRTAAVSTY